MYEPQRKYSLEEYWRVVEDNPYDKYEYIDGYIRMMQHCSVQHAQVAANVCAALHIPLRGRECHVYSSDAAVLLAGRWSYYPSLSISCDPCDQRRERALESPIVVVQVMSEMTERTDRKEKLEAYRRYPTIQDILLVDSRRRFVEHHQQVAEHEWVARMYERDEDVIELASVEVVLRVGDIYHKVWLELEEVEWEKTEGECK